MKRVLTFFFVTMGVIFCVVLMAIAYVVIADPFDIRSLSADAQTGAEVSLDGADDAADGHPLISDAQERALRAVGIDPALLPAEITPEMERCFEEALGEERTQEIAAGATPSPLDIYRARHCVSAPAE